MTRTTQDRVPLVLLGVFLLLSIVLGLVVMARRYERGVSPVTRDADERLVNSATEGTRSVVATPAPAASRTGSTESPPTREYSIATIDEFHRPVAFADVAWIGEGSSGPLELGRTDKTGSLRPISTELASGLLIARAPGHAVGDLALPEGTWSSATVVLPKGASIEGVLLRTETGAGTEGTVIAWPASMPYPPGDLVQRARSGDRRFHLATAAPDGRFELAHLGADQSYSVVAGGPGLAMDAPTVIAAGSSGVALKLSRLFGVSVELSARDSAGRDLLSGVLPASTPGNRAFEAAGATCIVQPSFALELAGLPPQAVYGSARGTVLLYSTTADVAALGPVSFRVALPAFRELSTELWLPPVERGLEVLDISLDPAVDAFGQLEVRFVNSPAPIERPAPGYGWVAQLSARSTGGQRHEFAVDPLAHQPRWVYALPFGEYDLRCSVSSTAWRWPAPGTEPVERVAIGAEPATWTVDLSDTGALELRLSRPDDSRYTGPAIAMVLRGSPGDVGKGGLVRFERPPYLVGALHPGVHTVRLVSPRAAASDSSVPLQVDVGRGDCVAVDIVVGHSTW